MTPATSILNAPRGLVRRWGLPAGTAGPGSLLDAVLAARGWTDLRDTWFSTGLRFTELEAPYLRDDFVAAAEVILAAIAAGRRIAIYGDYDADGLTATAILFHAIRAIEPGLVPRCYIPHRRQEGYGLHLQALRTLRAEGIDLVVTVDCGIVAVDEVAAARAEGLSIVITDHHAPRADGRLPEADAIVHPRLPGREHRSPDGCGALVAWKLAWTLFVRRTGSPDSHELPAVLKDERARLSALAAIGTVADLMPLLGENRELVRFGIRNSTRTGIEGLDALWRFGDISSDGVTAEAIAYRLAPRLNAAGRLGSAEIALRLLTAETDPRRCRELVRQLDELNKERKRQEHEAFEQALAMLRPAVAAEREPGRDSPDAIVLSDPRWNAGLVGIVCSRLLERFGCPVLLFEETDDGESVIAKGSGRAPPGFDLLQAIETSIAVSGIQPRKWGGHAAAAGMTLERRDLERFAAAFRDVASRHRTFAEFTSGIAIDLEFPPELPPELLSIDAIRELDRLEPFGRDNPRPTLLLRDVRITAAPQAIGREASHLALKLRLGKAERSSAFFEARWWRGAVHAPSLAPGMRCDAVVTPRIDRFRGETRVMLEITDLAPL